MKALYFDLNMGAAGDMLLAALLELMPDRDVALDMLNNMGIPGVRYEIVPEVKCGIAGIRMAVTVHGEEEGEGAHSHGAGEHNHRGVSDISNIISHLNVSKSVKKQALEIYELVAQAEGKVHGKPSELVHFHELGAMDAVADITGVCQLFEKLMPEKVFASPVTVGFGQVKCAHGMLPVPAPATAELLKGIPVKAGEIEGELCTPTGAALLRYFVDGFCPMPEISLLKTGHGCGKKDFESANLVRVLMGEMEEKSPETAELCCNLDDMTGEDIAFAAELLLESGALDVWTAPIYMKKSRPGVLLNCLCSADEADKFAELILKHTTTIGVRKKLCSRYTLPRESFVRNTPMGDVRVKVSRLSDGTLREKPEYEDLARLARSETAE